MARNTTPESLYGNSRDMLREAERENEILAEIAGEEYESPGNIPNGKYVIEKRLLDAAQKKNELLEEIAEAGPGGGSSAAKAIGIDYGTDIISLKNKDGETIAGSGATLPAYGVSFDPSTGGLTLTKNGTAVQGQTVTIPNYGSPVGVDASADMTDHDKIYLYLGTTGGGLTNGHFYYWDGAAWADGGEYAAATVQTDKTLLVEDRAADAKATGEAVDALKTQLDGVENELYPIETKTLHYADITWEGGYLNADGSASSHAAYKVSEYLPVSPGDNVDFDGLRSISSSYPILCGYNESKTHVDNSNVAGDGSGSQSGTYTVPSGVSFIRVSTYDFDGTLKFNSITMPVVGNRLDDLSAEIQVVDDKLDADMQAVDERLDDLEASLPYYPYTLGFDDYDIITGKGASVSGEYISPELECTDYISTDNMVSVEVSNVRMPSFGSGNYVCVVGCYDASKNLIQSKSLISDGTYGSINYITGTVTITDDIKYIRLTRINVYASTSIFVINKLRTLSEDYDVTKAEVADIEERMNPWKGKNWFVFGTSMSDDDYPNAENDNKPTGVFPKYLEAISGMKQFNHGRAGGTISTDPTSQYHPSGQIYTEITSTDFSTADLITLEGFINDYAECVALGNLGDTTQDTFYGALYLCIKYLSEHNTSATIVVITDPVGKEYTKQYGSGAGVTVDLSSTKINAIGLRQVDYNDAIIKTCQWMGVHCIDVGGESQINEYHPDYIVDQCHQTELGGKQFALTVWEKLKNIHCNDDVTVT